MTRPSGDFRKEFPYYRSPFEAYPYLSEPQSDLRCDYELRTDGMASYTGFLRAVVLESDIEEAEKNRLADELLWINELIYHLNPSARMGCKITVEERDRLLDLVDKYQEVAKHTGFVLPQGSLTGSVAHLLRCEAKDLVRDTYKLLENQGPTFSDGNGQDQRKRRGALGEDDIKMMIDVANILSGYFFSLSLHLNALEDAPEHLFQSRHYPVHSEDIEGRE